MLTIYYRMVGGFVGTGSTFLARARFALTIGLYMAFAALLHSQSWHVLTVLLLCALGAYLGRMIPHGRFQATATLANSLGMACVGLARLALILAPLAWFSGWPVMLFASFGALQGVAYWVGNKYLDGKDSGIYYKNQVFAKGGSEWGEVICGLLCYELMFIGILCYYSI